MRPRDIAIAKLVRVVPDLVRLVRRLLTDRTAPLGVRLALVALRAWFINPIDFIPEFVPGYARSFGDGVRRGALRA